jgi:predicted  nucleic acid-binding Zn-ribbon protein
MTDLNTSNSLLKEKNTQVLKMEEEMNENNGKVKELVKELKEKEEKIKLLEENLSQVQDEKARIGYWLLVSIGYYTCPLLK